MYADLKCCCSRLVPNENKYMDLPIQMLVLVGFGRELSGMWHLSDPSMALQAFGCYMTMKDGIICDSFM